MEGCKTAMVVLPKTSQLLCDYLVVIALALTVVAAPRANASTDHFPNKPIKFILGFGTGGPTDIIARTLADLLAKDIGQNVIVENRTGASGNIATQAIANADADGYSYLIAASPLAVNESLFSDFPVKFGRDIVAIAPVGATANVLVVRPSLNIRTLAELVARARSQPDAISYATLGIGSSSHLAGVALDLEAGTKMLPVSYRGGGDALKDLLGGQVDAWFAPISSVLGAVQAGHSGCRGSRTCQRCRNPAFRGSTFAFGSVCSRGPTFRPKLYARLRRRFPA
jgi:tripartite-type tricarboxylate transporter receptor subunit TctC